MPLQYRDETLPALTASLSILPLFSLASRYLLLDSVGQHGRLHATVIRPGVCLFYANFLLSICPLQPRRVHSFPLTNPHYYAIIEHRL